MEDDPPARIPANEVAASWRQGVALTPKVLAGKPVRVLICLARSMNTFVFLLCTVALSLALPAVFLNFVQSVERKEVVVIRAAHNQLPAGRPVAGLAENLTSRQLLQTPTNHADSRFPYTG